MAPVTPDTHVQEVRYRVERHVPLIHLVVQALEVQEREILEEVYASHRLLPKNPSPHS